MPRSTGKPWDVSLVEVNVGDELVGQRHTFFGSTYGPAYAHAAAI
jgi:hypothetical protein